MSAQANRQIVVGIVAALALAVGLALAGLAQAAAPGAVRAVALEQITGLVVLAGVLWLCLRMKRGVPVAAGLLLGVMLSPLLLYIILKVQTRTSEHRAAPIIRALEAYRTSHYAYPRDLLKLEGAQLDALPSTAIGLGGTHGYLYGTQGTRYRLGFQIFGDDYVAWYDPTAKKWTIAPRTDARPHPVPVQEYRHGMELEKPAPPPRRDDDDDRPKGAAPGINDAGIAAI